MNVILFKNGKGYDMGIFDKTNEQKQAQVLAPQILKQIEESMYLVNNTKTPDVFFSRYSFLYEKANQLIEINRYVKFKGQQPKEIILQLDNQYENAVYKFIDRYYLEYNNKINESKTKKAKMNKATEFYEKIKPHFNAILPQHVNKIEELYQNLCSLLDCPNI